MRTFEYRRATNAQNALDLLTDVDGSQMLAGGTDLVTLIKTGVSTPERLVDVKRVPELESKITENADGITLGALTSLATIENDPLLAQRYPLLRQAAASAATPQLRRMATLGGNLLQRPRCWYFRNPRLPCWLKGGVSCPARDGENQLHALFGDSICCAVHPSDLATCLVALQAHVRLRTESRRERSIPLDALFALPEAARRTETKIGNELLVAVHLPALADRTFSIYLKAMDRRVWSFAVIGVAAIVRIREGIIDDARIALGGVAPIPWRAIAAEHALRGQLANQETIAAAAAAATAGAQPLSKNAYKIPLVRALVQRALARLIERTAREQPAPTERKLDEALRETFPASDAPAVTRPD